MYLYLCTGIWSPVLIPTASIPDPESKSVLSKVSVKMDFIDPCITLPFFCYKISDASSDASLQEMLQEEEMVSRLVEAGYSKSLSQLSLSDRDDIMSSLVSFHFFLKVKAVMDQFREGLETSGLLHFMTKYTDLLRPLFVDERRPLTASKQRTFIV